MCRIYLSRRAYTLKNIEKILGHTGATSIDESLTARCSRKKICGTFAASFSSYTYYLVARSEFNRLGRNNLALITGESARETI